MGVLRKKLKHTVIQKYFFLEILINVKAGREKQGARKVYHGRRVGQTCSRASSLPPSRSKFIFFLPFQLFYWYSLSTVLYNENINSALIMIHV
jgi:hypothetical protein